MNNELIYVYCVTNSPPEPGLSISSEGLKVLSVNRFFAIVKHVSADVFSEENFKKNLSDVEWLESNARGHIQVINSVMENHTVIPFKFGTIFQSENRLRIFFDDYSDSLEENFRNIENREEWSVKIFCDRKKLCDQIDELSHEAASLELQIMASSPGKAFILKRKKTDLIENEMDRLCKEYGQKYYNQFRSLSNDANLNNLLPKEFTGREDTMILNAVFLVSRLNVADFKNTVDSLRKSDGNSGFFIDATGPWPPFSFISIKEKSNAR
jgi:hypothetical protein